MANMKYMMQKLESMILMILKDYKKNGIVYLKYNTIRR